MIEGVLANPHVSQLPRRAERIRELSQARALFELPMLDGQMARLSRRAQEWI